LRELIEFAEYHGQIAWKRGGPLRCERRTSARPLQYHGPVSVRERCGGIHDRPSAHTVTLETDVVLVHDIKTAQILQSVGAAESVCKRRRRAVPVARLIDREH